MMRKYIVYDIKFKMPLAQEQYYKMVVSCQYIRSTIRDRLKAISNSIENPITRKLIFNKYALDGGLTGAVLQKMKILADNIQLYILLDKVDNANYRFMFAYEDLHGLSKDHKLELNLPGLGKIGIDDSFITEAKVERNFEHLFKDMRIPKDSHTIDRYNEERDLEAEIAEAGKKEALKSKPPIIEQGG